jgi:DNA polymerase IV
MNSRNIVHLHIDSFFAEVERQRLRDLARLPVVVIKSSGRSSGVVVSASSEARLAGVVELMPARHARKLFPEGRFIAADYQLYREIRSQVMDIASVYSPLLEPHSLDNAYMDVTVGGNLFGSAVRIVEEIKQKVRGSLGLDISAGVGANKFVASAASFTAGPARVLQVEHGMEREFLVPLPVKLIWGVGEKAERRLADLGIQTIGQLASIPERFMVKQFGPAGSGFHRLALGVDYSSVLALYPPKIIKIERMFQMGENELEEPSAVEEYLPGLADYLAEKLRKQGEFAKGLILKLYLSKDGPASARIVAASRHLKRPTDSPVEISAEFRRLLYTRMQPGMKVGGIGLVLDDLCLGEHVQLSLVGDKALRMRRDHIVNAIRDRFGERAIFYGAALTRSRESLFFHPAA